MARSARVEQRVGILAARQLAAQLGVKRSAIEVWTRNARRSSSSPAEDLVGEVVEDEALAAPERLDERGGVRPVAERDRRQLEAGDPALGPIDEPRDEVGLEDEAGVGEIGRRLLDCVAQVVGPELDEPAVGPQAGERQRGILASQEDEMDERRAVLDQEADETLDRLRRDELVVVEDQHERLVARRHRLDERGADEIRGRVRPRAEEAAVASSAPGRTVRSAAAR